MLGIAEDVLLYAHVNASTLAGDLAAWRKDVPEGIVEWSEREPGFDVLTILTRFDGGWAVRQVLTDVFGIDRLALVVGGSMGAQQTYEWAVRYRGDVQRAAPIAGTAQNTPHDFLFTKALMEAITSDPGWAGGEYASHTDVADGLHRHAGIWSLLGLSTRTGTSRHGTAPASGR